MPQEGVGVPGDDTGRRGSRPGLWCRFLVAPGPRPAALAGGVQSGRAGPGFPGFWELRESGASLLLPSRDLQNRPETQCCYCPGGGVSNRSSKCLHLLTLPSGLNIVHRAVPSGFLGWDGPLEAPGVAAACAGPGGGQDEGSSQADTAG